MIETLRVRGTLPKSAAPRLSEDSWRRVTGPVGPIFVARETPPGISSVSYASAGGETRLTVEGNLTTCLYGSEAKAGTLTAPEVHRAVHAFTETALSAVPVAPDLRTLQVARFDPSESRVIGPGATPGQLVTALWAYVWTKRSKSNPVHLIGSNSDTVAWGNRGGDIYRRVYDKSGESDLTGSPCPRNVLRLEAERKPRHTLYLTEVEQMMELADSDLEQMSEWMAQSITAYVGLSVAALVEGQTKLGEKPNPLEAAKLAGVMAVISTEGVDGLLELGISRSSAYRVQKRVEELMTAAYAGKIHNATFQAWKDSGKLLARDLVSLGERLGTL